LPAAPAVAPPFTPLPTLTPVGEADLPPAAAALLRHDRGMTRKLEEHWGQRIDVEVLASEEAAGRITRRVVLRTADGLPTLLGHITIHMDRLPAAAHADIRAGALPFGTVLRRHAIAFRSMPGGFGQVRATGEVARRLDRPEGRILYGRTVAVRDADGTVLAEALEILSDRTAG
jgi:chorismate-pyruvate lyase